MQKLTFPQEVEVWYVFPAIRKELAIRLIKYLPQKEVAKLMNLTEAAISQYKKKKRATEMLFDAKISKEFEAAAKNIIKDKLALNAEIVRLSGLIKSSGIICALHKKKSSIDKENLPCANCTYCHK